MLIATLEFALLLTGCGGALLIYRRLVNSKRFSRFVNSLLRIPPESDAEVIEGVDEAKRLAEQRVADLVAETRQKRRSASELRKRTTK